MNNLDYFDLFGLTQCFNQDEHKIKQRYYQLQKHHHPDNYINASIQEKRLAMILSSQINDGYQILKNPLKRALYLLKLNGIDLQNETQTILPPELLEEQFELRERQSELTPEALVQKLQRKQQEIAKWFEEPIQLEKARIGVCEMQFYTKLLEDLES